METPDEDKIQVSEAILCGAGESTHLLSEWLRIVAGCLDLVESRPWWHYWCLLPWTYVSSPDVNPVEVSNELWNSQWESRTDSASRVARAV